MKAAIHQANYFPYPGFFNKLNSSDVFVVLDDVQYDKQFTNRNKIITNKNWTWISVPINKNHKFSPNNEVEINNDIEWKTLHWKKIFHSYNKAENFNLYRDFFEELYQKNWTFLFDLNFYIIKKILQFLNLKIEIIKNSELMVKGNGTERLVNICKKIGADTYISGIGGKDYMVEKLFEKNKIKLEYQKYSALKYNQHQSTEFIPNLSIIDLLSNMGPKSLEYIKNSH